MAILNLMKVTKGGVNTDKKTPRPEAQNHNQQTKELSR